VEDTRKLVTPGFKKEGDIIALLGECRGDISASEYARSVAGLTAEEILNTGECPRVDLEAERRLHEVLLDLGAHCFLRSAHDCSDGGLAVALAECCFSSLNHKAIGADIDLTKTQLSVEETLFGETPSRVVISFAPESVDRVREIAGDIPFAMIGRVVGDKLAIKLGGVEQISAPVADLERIWSTALGSKLESFDPMAEV